MRNIGKPEELVAIWEGLDGGRVTQRAKNRRCAFCMIISSLRERRGGAGHVDEEGAPEDLERVPV